MKSGIVVEVEVVGTATATEARRAVGSLEKVVSKRGRGTAVVATVVERGACKAGVSTVGADWEYVVGAEEETVETAARLFISIMWGTSTCCCKRAL